MPAFIGKISRAWRENIAGASGGIKLTGRSGRKGGGKGVGKCGSETRRCERENAGKKSAGANTSGSPNPN
jgi:hypothetical protein